MSRKPLSPRSEQVNIMAPIAVTGKKSIPSEGESAIKQAYKKRKTSAFHNDLSRNASMTESDPSFLDDLEMMIAEDVARSSQGRLADMEPEVAALGSRQVWQRPPVVKIDPTKDSLAFQQIEIDEVTEYGKGSILRLFGVTENGHSVMCHIFGFLPYFYIAAPPGFQTEHIARLKNTINMMAINAISHIEVLQKENIYGYRGGKASPFLKLYFTESKCISRVKGLFERGEIQFEHFFQNGAVQTFESNIGHDLRFMIDLNMMGMSWVECPAGKYSIRSKNNCISNCQIEVDCRYDYLISYPPDDEWAKVAPLRILSFDIECAGRKGIFPEPDKDPVIQIANMVSIHGQQKPFIRNVFTLDTCAHIAGTEIYDFVREADMLRKWRDFIEQVDPDVIIGYNIQNFDFPYLIDRAKNLNVIDFPYFTRIRKLKSEVKDARFSSKAYGMRDNKVINTDGRIQFDMLQVVQRDYKLRSYTLNAVCAEFLGEQKEDVHHSIITELQNGNAETRRRLAVYCLKDAYLPQRLMDRLMCFVNYSEMARVTGVPFNYLLARGQQVKVVSQLFRKAMTENFVVPAMKVEGTDEMYEGATVLEPKRGYYDKPIATLDFSSLYPSIMMAHNLCYTTLIDPKTAQHLNLKKDVDYIVTPNNDFFVSPSIRKGLLPVVLNDLLSARKRAKDDLKKETDPFKRAVLDGRQLALKISANSVYGFTGATVGKLPCLPISTSVTAFGRQMIDKTKEEVEKKYNSKNGYPADAVVIYGDTDSVMVDFGAKDLHQAMDLGREAAAYVTKKFINPIKLEFEKVYYPYLLINKKRYAGLYWTNPNKWDKMDTKGIETVRRDNCRLVVSMLETCLHKLLIEHDVEGAQEYVKSTIADLLQNKIDMSQLVITKALAKQDYAAKQAHVELADRMKKRDAGSAPALGDRVAYIIIKKNKDSPAYERSEDPIYVLDNNLPIDTKYYLENQLSKPLMRIFEPIMGESKANSLLNGAHTRKIQVATPSIGGLMKFAVKTTTCLGCKAPLKDKNAAVCDPCKRRLPELHSKHMRKLRASEVKFSRLWTQCQRCQGSLHQDVICTSRDCPIFYMRKKAQKDVNEVSSIAERFDYSWDSW